MSWTVDGNSEEVELDHSDCLNTIAGVTYTFRIDILRTGWARDYVIKLSHSHVMGETFGVCAACGEEIPITDTGFCGDNVKWTLFDNGLMVISGTGAMWDKEIPGEHDPEESFKAQIQEVRIENGVTSIGAYVFYGCYNLSSVRIPDSVTSIGSSAFEFCDSLTSVDLGNGVTSIGDYAFYWCSSLTCVEIPDSVTSINEGVFRGCISLTSFVVGTDNMVYSTDESGCLYNKDKTVLIQYPVGRSQESFAVPDGVLRIRESAFYDCENLKSIDLGNSLTSRAKRGGLHMSSLSDDRKNYYHIEIPRQLSQSLWKLLEENYDLIITRQQHTPDGKDLHIELKVP